MFTLIRTAAVVFVLTLSLLAPRASADSVATLQGVVKDANGHLLSGAEIRIQGSDPNKIGRIHTDAHGRYAYPALESGAYSVTLLVDGTVKASIKNVKTKVGETETLNFELQKGLTAKPFAKGKHYVWIPAGDTTGSHLGTWMEVDDNAKPMSSGMQERIRWQANADVRTIQSASASQEP
jgi:hypothetical protein